MDVILRQQVLNQMYFEDLPLARSINMLSMSRYLFLEYLPSFSLILVGNQGAHDLHLFRLTNKIDVFTIPQLKKLSLFEEIQEMQLQRVYVYKHANCNVRILGVNVQEDKQAA